MQDNTKASQVIDIAEACRKRIEEEQSQNDLSPPDIEPAKEKERFFYEFNYTKISRLFVEDSFSFNGQPTVLFAEGAFWRWEGVQWIEVSPEIVKQEAYRYFEDKRVIVETKDGSQPKYFNPNASKINYVLDALKSSVCTQENPYNGSFWLQDADALGAPQDLIPFRNGLFDLHRFLLDGSIRIYPHTPSFFNTYHLPFDFSAVSRKIDEWLLFLNSLWPSSCDADCILLLQEWFGLCLTTDTRFQKGLLLLGPPRSGKGTIIQILQQLVGIQNAASSPLGSLGKNFGLQPLLGKTLLSVSDARISRSAHQSVLVERLLSIIGEDPLTIDRKFLAPTTTQLICRVLIATNEPPSLNENSGALASRFLILPMEESWLGREDITLLDKLKLELPGIVWWALEGLQRLYENQKFTIPESSKPLMDELIRLTSPVRAFLDDICEIGTDYTILKDELWSAWTAWCEKTNTPKGRESDFGKSLRAALPSVTNYRPNDKGTRPRHYRGLRLTEDFGPGSPGCFSSRL